ncbi:hypothetical protein RD792_013841 [Penstemon davidsonii]|uniref:ABC1 atypical kinase-like domain-containing protein n=1 Tax=Penstemon davidsonii TaxID=160366 RepID=A0ABR0CUM6_9LAMI|nr:hypothetical protein RD792_013841 [Penstemon davidsonii]
MVNWKEIGRVVNGLSLVAKESSCVLLAHSSNGGQLQSLIKAAVLSATDITGLTKGNLRRINQTPHQQTYFKADDDNFNNNNADAHIHKTSFTDAAEAEAEATTLTTADADDATPLLQSISNTNTNTNINTAADRDAAYADPPSNSTSVAAAVTPQKQRRKPRERRVPSTPFSRAIGFAGLGAGLAWGTLQESAKRIVYGTPNSQNSQNALSPFMSEKNAERLALALCRMRGAALKLGQMLSIQDESLVPAPILAALDIVRQGADMMPKNQLNQVLDTELGSNWSSKLTSFDYEPMAAASIGQVHQAVTKDDLEVAIKIQYPGVADSIESDIENVKLLLSYTNLIPEKMFIDNAMKVAKEELSRECNYELEAENQKKFRGLLAKTKGFYVPSVVDDLSSKKVLTTELVPGKCTDPNWSNFLYDEAERSINLIDFGAARDFPKNFVDDYLRMVVACANSDKEAVVEMSRRLGFLTGTESEIMLDAHVQAGFIVGLPFAKHGGYDFGSTNITQSISHLGATMLRHRLTPPPEEAYSLHRKLSGAFLACIKLEAVVPCRELLLQVYENYKFAQDSTGEILSRTSV